MINRLACWLFGHRPDWAVWTFAVKCNGAIVKKPIGPCTRCGNEQQ